MIISKSRDVVNNMISREERVDVWIVSASASAVHLGLDRDKEHLMTRPVRIRLRFELKIE